MLDNAADVEQEDAQELGRRIDNYILELFTTNAQDAVLLATLENMQHNGLPPINVSANEGYLLYFLAKMSGAKKILEIGTLGAYSTIWLARALPKDGKLITLEYSLAHARVARENIQMAGLSNCVEVRVGAASDTLPQIATNGENPFDLFFIDADKGNYPLYLDWAIKLARPGSIILSDNLIRNGAVINDDPPNEECRVTAKYNRELATNSRLESIVVPIIRDVIDGLGITIVR